ncbi:MAG: GGDEF domain-containing protein [Succinivibrio sp.]
MEKEEANQVKAPPAQRRRRRLLRVQTFVLIVFTPMLAVIVGVLFFFYNEFRAMAVSSEQLTQEVVPQIFNAQKVFINIDALRYHLATIHESVSRSSARVAFVSAQSILTDLGDDNAQFSAPGSAVLLRQLQTFWYSRLELEGKQNDLLKSLNSITYYGVLIDNALGLHEPSEVQAWVRELSLDQASMDGYNTDGVSRVKSAARRKLTECSSSGTSSKASHECSVYYLEYNGLTRRLESFELALNRFNVMYDQIKEQVNELVVQSSSIETRTINSHLSSIVEAARNSAPLVFISLITLFVLMAASVFLIYRYVSYPLTLIMRVITIFRSRKHSPRTFPTSSIQEIDAISGVLPKLFDDVYRSEVEARDTSRNYMSLLDASYKDELTGVGNRRALDAFMAEMDKRPSTEGMCVLMIDIDHFKDFNDRRGHQYGDYVLKTIAKTLVKSLSGREGDVVYRYGGEEFVVVLNNIEARQRLSIGLRLCEQVRKLGIPNPANDTGLLTISVGASPVTGLDAVYSVETLITKADKAMYEAKNGGRNRVVVCSAQ